MSRLRRIVSDMAFRRKILLLWIFVGVIPMILLITIFVGRVMQLVEYQSRYALRQSFEQTYQSIENRVNGMEEIARFLLADRNVQSTFSRENQIYSEREYLDRYEKIESTRRIFVNSIGVDEIVFYLDAELPMAGKSNGNKYRNLFLLEQEEWCYSMLENRDYARWGIIKTDSAGFMEEYLSYIHIIQDPENFDVINGFLCLSVRQEKLKELLLPVLEEQYLYLETPEGDILCSDISRGSLGVVPREGEVVRAGTSWYCLSKEVDSSGIILVSATPKWVLTWKTAKSLAGLMVVLFLLLGMICLIYLQMSSRLTKRIISLAEVCRKSERGILTKVEESGGNDEIGVLCIAFNRMTDKIEDLLKEQYRIGEEVKDAQLKALQAQISPHFLYNTLEMISWMAVREDKRSVQNIVRSLSIYYKSVLNKGRDEIHLWDEIRMGISYMEIQSCRFKGKINFRSDTDDLIPDIIVPKLILQPLLENAIFHGVTKKPERRGNIWMRAHRADGQIILEISDDGVGFKWDESMEENNLKSTQAEPEYGNMRTEMGSKYGLANIEKRIELFWRQRAKMIVESTPGIGTSVYILIPEDNKSKGEAQ